VEEDSYLCKLVQKHICEQAFPLIMPNRSIKQWKSHINLSTDHNKHCMWLETPVIHSVDSMATLVCCHVLIAYKLSNFSFTLLFNFSNSLLWTLFHLAFSTEVVTTFLLTITNIFCRISLHCTAYRQRIDQQCGLLKDKGCAQLIKYI